MVFPLPAADLAQSESDRRLAVSLAPICPAAVWPGSNYYGSRSDHDAAG